MKKIVYILFAFILSGKTTNGQSVYVSVAEWGVATNNLLNGKIKYESNNGETPFNTVLTFGRLDGSTQVRAQAIYIFEGNGLEIPISDSIIVNTGDFTQNTGVYWSKEFAKTAKLQPNNKNGIVKLKWRFFNNYSGGTNQWSPYYYAAKTYETISPVPPEVVPPYQGANTLYRMFQPETGRHLISRSYAQVGDLITNSNWVYEHVIGFIYKTQQGNTVPLYAYYNESINDHYYSTSPTTPSGYIKENTIGYVYTQQVSNAIPIYGYYMPGGEHFFTKNWSELENGKYGYQYEGVAFYLLP